MKEKQRWICETARELWQVTEWRNDSVYKARNTGKIVWISLGCSAKEFNKIQASYGPDALLLSVSDYDEATHFRIRKTD